MANGGTLVEIEISDGDTEVRVRVGDAVAVARGAPGAQLGREGNRVHAMTGDDEISSSTDTAAQDASRTLPRVPVDGPDSPPQSTTEAPPPRRARRVTPEPGIAATAVADPMLAADAAAAEASNGDHPADQTAPTPVVAPATPRSSKSRSSKPRKTAAAKATAPGVTTAAVDVDLPPTEAIEAVKTDEAPAEGKAPVVSNGDTKGRRRHQEGRRRHQEGRRRHQEGRRRHQG